MEYSIRLATAAELPHILEIYAYARKFMAENGNPHQWGATHPAAQTLEEDIRQGQLYAVTAGDEIHGVFMFFMGEDPTYRQIFEGDWLSDAPYGTIHRIASDGSGGVLKAAVAFCRGKCAHLRIDTHHDNHIMQRAIEKTGFSRRGIIYIADGTPRIAYERVD